ncbi:hypothetical protein ACFRH6_18670 [Streptomyces sp. NPDC056749]|uniref:hypothetical protein n=1 Tax=Streptomyces sp. NPDC056749 TaxID=3345936 RepID=UPI0036951092
MGRHKQHKPRRPRGESGQPATEWFGTAFHSIEGMQHLDVRQSGNGILITSVAAAMRPERRRSRQGRPSLRGDVVFERSAERPIGLWAEAGESLLRILPLLGPDAPPADELEDCRLCPGCYRPVYESSSSHTLIGAGPLPLMGLCRLCAEGTTLRSLRQADVPIDTRQRTVLETVAAALA